MDGAQKKLFAARREYAERFKPCAFQIEVMDNTEYEEERRTLQESELPRYKEKFGRHGKAQWSNSRTISLPN